MSARRVILFPCLHREDEARQINGMPGPKHGPERAAPGIGIGLLRRERPDPTPACEGQGRIQGMIPRIRPRCLGGLIAHAGMPQSFVDSACAIAPPPERGSARQGKTAVVDIAQLTKPCDEIVKWRFSLPVPSPLAELA